MIGFTIDARELSHGAQDQVAVRTESLPDFREIYDLHAEDVWRNLRRLGVADANLEDALQDVFIVLHRKLTEFDPRRSMKTWLFGIALRVARDHRRTVRRKGGGLPLHEEVVSDGAPGPYEAAVKSEALQILDRLLDHLDDDRREVFVLAEVEQMSVPEIAEALGVNVNTVYSRLRSARSQFEGALARSVRGQP